MGKEYVNLKLEEIKPYEKNPRDNSNAVDAVAKSIEEYGFNVPIVLDKNHVIIAGHTRYKAAQKLGLNEVPCIIAYDLSEEQAKAYRIADNKTSDFSIWDNKLLLVELEELKDFDLFTGFDYEPETFDVLDEKDNTPITDNEEAITYEVVFRSEDKEKIEKIKQLWNEIENG